MQVRKTNSSIGCLSDMFGNALLQWRQPLYIKPNKMFVYIILAALSIKKVVWSVYCLAIQCPHRILMHYAKLFFKRLHVFSKVKYVYKRMHEENQKMFKIKDEIYIPAKAKAKTILTSGWRKQINIIVISGSQGNPY